MKTQLVTLQTDLSLLKSENERFKLEAQQKDKLNQNLQAECSTLTKLMENSRKSYDSTDLKTAALVKENDQLHVSIVRVQQEIQKLDDVKRDQTLEIENLNDRLSQSFK